MGSKSKIEWTDHSFNPWWGCTKVSPACDHCYAESFSARVGYSETGSQFPIWGKDAKRRMFGDKHWNEPYKWNAAAAKAEKPAYVFCASMADVMEDHPGLWDLRQRLFAVIELTPWLNWILLTKRPQNFRKMLPKSWLESPRPNVIGATTVESQEYIWRADELSQTPFAYRALSVEPMLGPLNLRDVLWIGPEGGIDFSYTPRNLIHWVFAGGESGHGARPMQLPWVRSLRDQCANASVPFLFKQWGEYRPTIGSQLGDRDPLPQDIAFSGFLDGNDKQYGLPVFRAGKKAAGRLLDGVEWNGFPEVKR
jgi:protein gp37